MLDITAGLATQIRQLERRLKDMDASKEKPALVKEITDTIKNLKELLKEKQDKKEQRKKLKEEKAKASTEEVKVEADVVTDKVEHLPEVAPHVIVPDSVKKHDEIVEKVENNPAIAPHIISEKELKTDLHKFSIDDKVEPVHGQPGSWGYVMRQDGVNEDPLVYVKWIEGPIKEKHGEYGGYKVTDLRKKMEAPKPEAIDMTAVNEMKTDLEGKYRSMLEDLKVEKQNALDQGNHPWAKKLEQKIIDLEAVIQERFGDGRENGSGGTERLTVVDQTPSSSNDITDNMAGKDSSDEYQDMWANSDVRDLHNEGALVTKRYALYVGGRLAIRTMTRAKALDIVKEKFPKDFAAKNFEIKEEEFKAAGLTLSIYKQAWKAIAVKKEDKSGYDVLDNNDNKVMHIALKDSQELSKDQLEHIVAKELEKGFKQAFLREDVGALKKGTKVFILASDKNKVKIASLEQNVRGWTSSSKLSLVALDAQTVRHGDHSDKVLGSSSTETLLDCANGPVWVSSTELLDNNRPPATPESLTELESAMSCPRCESTDTGSDFKQEGKHYCKRCGNEWGGEDKEALKTQLPTKIFPQRGDVMEGSLKQADQSDWSNDATLGEYVFLNSDVSLRNVVEEFAKRAHSTEHLAKMLEDNFAADTDPSVDWKQIASKFIGMDIDDIPVMDVQKKRDELLDKLNNPELAPKHEEIKRELHRLQSSLKTAALGTCRHCKKPDVAIYQGVCDSCLDSMWAANSRESSLKVQSHIRHENGKWVVWNHDYTKKLGTYPTKEAATKRLRQIEYFKHQGSLRPFSKKATIDMTRTKECIEGNHKKCRNMICQCAHHFDEYKKNKKAEVLSNPYQALTDHVTEMKSRMEQVQQRMQSAPTTKVAGEDNSEMDMPTLFADLTQGIDLLETKLGGDDIEPEMHSKVEELENLLWKLEMECGITPKLSEHEKEEPEHKEIVEEIEHEAAMAGDVSLTVTDSTVADPNATSPASTSTPAVTPSTPDDKAPNCQICGGITFGDYAAYQNHMEYTHASDIMPTTPDQRRKDPVAASLKKADAIVPVVDPNAPATTPISTDPNQPVDFDGEDSVQMPTSPLPPGQKWVFDVVTNQYIAMTDPSNPSKII